MGRNIELRDNGQLQLFEAKANGANKVTLKSAASVASDATITIPATDGGTAVVEDSNGQISVTSVQQTTQTVAIVSDDTTKTINIQSGNRVKITAANTGTCTLTISNLRDGEGATFVVIQDSTGTRDVVFPAAWKWPGGIAFDSSAAAGDQEDVISVVNIDSVFYAAIQENFS